MRKMIWQTITMFQACQPTPIFLLISHQSIILDHQLSRRLKVELKLNFCDQEAMFCLPVLTGKISSKWGVIYDQNFMPLILTSSNNYANTIPLDLVMVRFHTLGMMEPQKEVLDYVLTTTIWMAKSHQSPHIRRQRLPSYEGSLKRWLEQLRFTRFKDLYQR